MKKVYVLILLFITLGAASMNAQVTIGSLNQPHKAAILDLDAINKGLLLPLVNLDTDPTVFVLELNEETEKLTAAGMIVYNIADVQCGPGIYYWNGSQWNALQACDLCLIPAVPDEISGASSVCADGVAQTYEIVEIAGATTYTWSFPTGWNFDSGNTTNNMTATPVAGAQSGNIAVTANNDCGSSAERTLTVTVNAKPNVSITSTETTTCMSSNLNMTATPTGGTWSSETTATATIDLNTGVLTPIAAGTTVITYSYTDGNSCINTDTKTITVISNVTPAVSIAVSAGSNPTCDGTALSFTATPSNGGTPSYQWKVDGVNAGTNSASFTYNSPVNGAKVSCVMTSNANCASPTQATSNEITVTVNAKPSVSITSTETSTTMGVNLNMTASPAGGTWSSGTPATATINSNTGILIPVAAGTTIITYSYTDPVTGCTNKATKTITVKPPLDVSGNYRLSGKSCFDLAQGNDDINDCKPLVSRKNDFADATPSYVYTFVPLASNTYSSLSFTIDDPEGLVASNTKSISSGINPSTLTIVFNKAAVLSKASNTTKETALEIIITATYKDNTNANRHISFTLKVQDCSCGCSVKSGEDTWLTFMCYNLGANETMTIAQQMAYIPSPNAVTTTDATVYGDLYQWGRRKDGHQLRTSSVTATNATVSTNIVGHGDFIANNSTVKSDWRQPSNDNLWGSSKTANDPCPEGWRVPTNFEWSNVIYNNTWEHSGTTNTKGYTITIPGETTPSLFLPAMGLRGTAGSINNSGTHGYYWTSTPNTISITAYSYSLAFSNQGPSLSSNNTPRGMGLAVRCVSE